MLNINTNKLITIALLITASLGMQSSYADSINSTDNKAINMTQSTLIDWNQRTQAALSLRLEEKLQNQLVIKNHEIEMTQLAQHAEPDSNVTMIVLAENSLSTFH